jgi:hypothetical protein
MTDEERKVAADKKAADEALAAAQPSEVQKLLKDKDDRIAVLSTEKENYRRGLIAKKGKTPEGTDVELTLDEKIEAGVQEKMIEDKIAQTLQEKNDIINKALERNKELETTIKNRSQITTTEGGAGNEQKIVAKDNTLSDDKIKGLKARGFTDAMIERYKKNLANNPA